ncbi:MAG: hypothetical protein KatS3mg035_0479 [Bacteroidia bacterium]|nr:MAG: hypothetical protein KatS3mg035_0479 [Bacteroidia bacterium]
MDKRSVQRSWYFIGIQGLVLIYLFCACKNQNSNDWVNKVLYFDNQQLRTQYILHSIQEVKSIEKLPLKFEDEAGLAYQLNLDPNTTAEISYFRSIEDTTYKVIAFSVNIFFAQEKQAIEIYKSFENHFQKLYGVFDGTFGNQEWIIPDINYRITLKLQNQKKEILITCSSIS